MKKPLILTIAIALFAALTGLCRAQSDAPYTEGPVWTVTMVKAKYGMGDEYLRVWPRPSKGPLMKRRNRTSSWITKSCSAIPPIRMISTSC